MYYLTEEDYAVAKLNGIGRNIAYKRYYAYGYDVKRAITEPVGTTKRITTNMLLWEEWKEVAEKNGISKKNFYNRLNSKAKVGWTPEQAATYPVILLRNTRINKDVYELAKDNGIKATTLRNRVFNLHWNPHHAATEPVDKGVLI